VEKKKLGKWEDEKVGKKQGRGDGEVLKVELGPAVVLKGRTMARQDAEGGKNKA
jgi:hypothetical protein